MTWGGGKPHNVGDKGQRYEVSYVDKEGLGKVFGWSDTLEGARSMARSIDLNPSMDKPYIWDREKQEWVLKS